MVRVVGIDEYYACVLTSDGKTGYVEPGQIVYLTKEEFDFYLHQSCERPESDFDRETLIDLASSHVGEESADPAEFLYAVLAECGLHFNEGYYRSKMCRLVRDSV